MNPLNNEIWQPQKVLDDVALLKFISHSHILSPKPIYASTKQDHKKVSHIWIVFHSHNAAGQDLPLFLDRLWAVCISILAAVIIIIQVLILIKQLKVESVEVFLKQLTKFKYQW